MGLHTKLLFALRIITRTLDKSMGLSDRTVILGELDVEKRLDCERFPRDFHVKLSRSNFDQDEKSKCNYSWIGTDAILVSRDPLGRMASLGA